MSFLEERLNLGIDYGTSGGPRYSTSIITDGGGGEQRNINWSQPLGRWLLGGRSLNKSELDYFLAFHKNVKGMRTGFRFKDWGDFRGALQLVGTGNGTTTQFQLYKTYGIAPYFSNRPITKIVSGTGKIYFNGAEQATGWMINNNTGVLTFASPPANGVTITADFEFDVPVRFEQDQINFKFEAADEDEVIFALEQLSLVEVRIPSLVPKESIPQSIPDTLNLGYDYGTVGGPQFNTSIYPVGANFEERVSNWSESRGRWNIGDRTLKRSELDYFINFFRVVRGAGVGFYFKDWQTGETILCRFESDAIAFRFDAFDPVTEEAIFYLAGVSVVQIGCELKTLLFSVTSSFNKDLNYPPNGAYSFPIAAPSSLAAYDDCKIKAYITSASWDNGAVLGYFWRDPLGSFSGNELIGIGKKNYTALINQYASGPCYFSGQIRWEVWS